MFRPPIAMTGPDVVSFTPLSATGGTIVDVGDWRTHEFTASGTFQITALNSSDGQVFYEMVGGGGEAGSRASGNYNGPGAGASYLTGSDTLIATSYSIVVGAGAAVDNAAAAGGAGSDSTYNGHTASGGSGGGASNSGANGLTTKPNGGGGASAGATSGLGGNGSGFDGGNAVSHASDSSQRAAGGAGGAGGAGTNATTGAPGAFGAGVTSVCPGKSDILGEGGAGKSTSTSVNNSLGPGSGGNGSQGGTGSGSNGVAGVVRVWYTIAGAAPPVVDLIPSDWNTNIARWVGSALPTGFALSGGKLEVNTNTWTQVEGPIFDADGPAVASTSYDVSVTIESAPGGNTMQAGFNGGTSDTGFAATLSNGVNTFSVTPSVGQGNQTRMSFRFQNASGARVTALSVV